MLVRGQQLAIFRMEFQKSWSATTRGVPAPHRGATASTTVIDDRATCRITIAAGAAVDVSAMVA